MAPLIIKPACDTRYQRQTNDEIVTHRGRRISAVSLTSLTEYIEADKETYSQTRFVIIDEAHMFDPNDLVNFCQQAADKDGKTFIGWFYQPRHS